MLSELQSARVLEDSEQQQQPEASLLPSPASASPADSAVQPPAPAQAPPPPAFQVRPPPLQSAGGAPPPPLGGLALKQPAGLKTYPSLNELFRMVTGMSAAGAGRGAGASHAYDVDRKVTDGMISELQQKGARFRHIAALHAEHKGELQKCAPDVEGFKPKTMQELEVFLKGMEQRVGKLLGDVDTDVNSIMAKDGTWPRELYDTMQEAVACWK